MTTTDHDPLKVISTIDKEWYQEGLRFKCTGCGNCCTGSPGAVWISDDEIEKISKHLAIPISDFLKQYTRLIDGKRSLNEDPQTYDCVFLKGNRCSIYSHRPLQCKTYPWWPNNLRSKSEWLEAAKWCEGIDHPDSDKVSFSSIQQQLQEHIDGGGH
ncbi:MAG: YkgJ family cysteine cluster protein [Chlamydiota bacterium]